MSGVICDRRIPARMKGEVYTVAVRPTMLYGLETVAMTKRQEEELEVAELEMLKFEEKVREARLRWFGHVLRKDARYSLLGEAGPDLTVCGSLGRIYVRVM